MSRDYRTLTIGEVLEVVSYDKDSGEFRWLKSFTKGRGRMVKNCVAGEIATVKGASGYQALTVNCAPVLAHRLAWFICNGEWPQDTDHRDGNRQNNRISNLRDVPRRLNSQNVRSAHKDSSSGLLGAYFCNKRLKWYSSICKDGKSKFLGYVASAEEAHASYVKAKRVMHECCEI